MHTISKFIVSSVLICTPQLALTIDATEEIKVTPLLKTQESWDGKKIAYPTGTAEVTAMQVEIAPGAETGWHLHPVPSFGMVLEGELEVELESGQTLLLKQGEVAAETVNVYHNGR
ncbi:MAG: cupin domain-containing protein [Halioglobus sp.]|nr:cupin domain-containing protein [Halioglobus sp.]